MANSEEQYIKDCLKKELKEYLKSLYKDILKKSLNAHFSTMVLCWEKIQTNIPSKPSSNQRPQTPSVDTIASWFYIKRSPAPYHLRNICKYLNSEIKDPIFRSALKDFEELEPLLKLLGSKQLNWKSAKKLYPELDLLIKSCERGIPFPKLLEEKRSSKKLELLNSEVVKTQIQLPSTGNSKLFGRNLELSMLQSEWKKNKTNIIVLEAMGGTGKTSLVKAWLDSFNNENSFKEAERIYAFSFYAQGSVEISQNSAEIFFDSALKWFGYKGKTNISSYNKGIELAKLINNHRTLLVLDGLEPLQYLAGPMRGELKDSGLKSFFQQLASNNRGLCLITSRHTVVELLGKPLVITRTLNQLEENDAIELLQFIEIEGPREELLTAAKEVGFHALTLNLLGNYLRTVFNGDIRQRDRIPFLSDERNQGKHAEKIMAAYEVYLTGTVALSVMYIMGLFDRPTSYKTIQYLREADILNFNQNNEREWQYALDDLKQQHLLSSDNYNQEKILDAHPLVREYFGKQFLKKYPDIWNQAHSKLYYYYQLIPRKALPDTLGEMEPLFVSVAHGCAAGLYKQVFNEVYWPRIRRKKVNYLCVYLGAFSTDLSLLSHFFEKPWHILVKKLTGETKADILSWTAFRLRALGRLNEVIEPMLIAVQIRLDHSNWVEAAMDTSSISELLLTQGKIDEAHKYAEKCVTYSKKINTVSVNALWQVGLKTTLADAEHSLGETSNALQLFKRAENLQYKWQPEFLYLYTLWGFRYCDLLLTMGKPEVAHMRAKYALEASLNGVRRVQDIGLHKLSLSRACLQQAIAKLHLEAIPTFSNKKMPIEMMVLSPSKKEGHYLRSDVIEAINKSKDWLEQAIDSLREAELQYLIRALIARAITYRWFLSLGLKNFGDNDEEEVSLLEFIKQDLSEVYGIIERSGMRLFLTDYHLESARLSKIINKKVFNFSSEIHTGKAKKLIDQMNYNRRLPEVVYLENIYSS